MDTIFCKVEKKPLKQWFFKTTKFSESLLEGRKFNYQEYISLKSIPKQSLDTLFECANTHGKSRPQKCSFKVDPYGNQRKRVDDDPFKV